jgi:TolA-binding protein
MRKTVLLLLFLLCAGLNSFAQIKEGDLLISRHEYLKLKNELRYKSLLLDSMDMACKALFAENELLLGQLAERLDKSQLQVASLQQDKQKMQLAFQAQKGKTNEFRYAYLQSGRFRERAQISTVWAALMSVGFIMAAGEKYTAAYILGGGSAALTLFLAIKAGQAGKNAGSL